jgi:phosphoribosylamine--glycine ligase
LNILILGGGGREHALAWAFAANPKCDRLWCAPGNAGIAEVADCVALDILDGSKVLEFVRENAVDFVAIGPEAPLAEGVADDLRAGGVLVLGPSRAAARLEASKSFTKEICAACGAPTAQGLTFTDPAAARAYVAAQGAPIVVKADGLAAGKGVTVAATEAEAQAALDAIFAEGPGARVVIEAVLPGEEASLFVLADGEDLLVLGTAQDHKRAFDGDRGPNTGGMGAYSPAPVMTPQVVERALAEIVRPTLAEMVRRGTRFQGVLYAGLMVETGAPRLVEYNVRFGDPETQAIALRLGAQLLDACLACAEGRLKEARVNWAEDHALCVTLAARGYPGAYARGEAIALPAVEDPRARIFHAGTRIEGGELVSDGGRVLTVAARAGSLGEARALAYAVAEAVDWPGGFFRRDIGWRALAAGAASGLSPAR